mmetsp:Transcript_43916/g.80251  ORF Transcript_43916/g.80251 Transcript_43916/m.80251 type:complete len:473 (-) Transcript_43916:119-1537(-)
MQATSVKPASFSALEVSSLDVATPSRVRNQAGPSEACSGIPSEAAGLVWPSDFLESPRGERLDLSEGNSCATRRSGVGRGIGFIGPLKVDRQKVYFEIEVMELEAGRSQTLALGVCSSLPPPRPVLLERAKDLGEGSYVIGYDLPKLFANGAEVAKVPAKEWRPLKEVVQGTRIGLLVQRQRAESVGISVFMNGHLKVSLTTKMAQWPTQMWGIVDVQGTVRSVRLLGPSDDRRCVPRDAPIATPSSPPPSLPPTFPATQSSLSALVAQLPNKGKTLSTQDLSAALGVHAGVADCATAMPPPPPLHTAVDDECLRKSLMRSATQPFFEGGRAPKREAPEEVHPNSMPAGAEARKRQKLLTHPCGCALHLISHNGAVVHVPQADFVIGRNPATSNLTLDSALVPGMASRVHARLLSTTETVEIMDCKSVNGTWVNGQRIERCALRQGDVVVIGSPPTGLAPAEFRFSISMPHS